MDDREDEDDVFSEDNGIGETSSKKRLVLIGLGSLLLLLGGSGVFFERKKLFSSTHSVSNVKKDETILLDIPTTVSNLDGGDGRSIYVKLTAKIEVSSSDKSILKDKVVIIQDVLQTYLHETRREEIRGSGIYRLREAILRRLRIELAPIDVKNIYFVDFLIQ